MSNSSSRCSNQVIWISMFRLSLEVTWSHNSSSNSSLHSLNNNSNKIQMTSSLASNPSNNNKIALTSDMLLLVERI